MYGFAVAYLTSEEGPGAPLGNLYYSTWLSFGIVFFVATSCFEEYQAAKTMILTGRQKQSPPQSILRDTDSLAPSTNVSTHNDLGGVGSGRDRDVEVWGDASVGKDSKFSTGSSSVGEVQIS